MLGSFKWWFELYIMSADESRYSDIIQEDGQISKPIPTHAGSTKLIFSEISIGHIKCAIWQPFKYKKHCKMLLNFKNASIRYSG